MRPGFYWFLASIGLAILIGCAGVAGPLGGGGKTSGLNGGATTSTTGGTTAATDGSSSGTTGSTSATTGSTDATTGGTTGTTTGTTGTTTGGGGGVTVDVQMVDMTFSPQIVNAHAGDTVRWTNISVLPHTVTSDTGQTGLSSSTILNGNTFTWQVPADATAGTNFFYHCNFHGAAGNGTSLGFGMSGEISVN